MPFSRMFSRPGLVRLHPALLRLRLEALVEPPLEVGELALQLRVALPASEVELAGRERRPNRAARLGAVRAVVEAAAEHELLDVGERLAEALRRIPELELPQAGRVDDEPAARQQDELPVRRRVPALAVVLADRPASRAAPRPRACSRASTCRRPRSRAARSCGRARAASGSGRGRRRSGWRSRAPGGRRRSPPPRATRSAYSGHRSVFVSTITGWAPLSQAVAM